MTHVPFTPPPMAPPSNVFYQDTSKEVVRCPRCSGKGMIESSFVGTDDLECDQCGTSGLLLVDTYQKTYVPITRGWTADD